MITPQQFLERAEAIRIAGTYPKMTFETIGLGSLLVYIRNGINLYLWKNPDGSPDYIVKNDGPPETHHRRPDFGEYINSELFYMTVIGFGPNKGEEYSWLNVVTPDGSRRGYVQPRNYANIRIIA